MADAGLPPQDSSSADNQSEGTRAIQSTGDFVSPSEAGISTSSNVWVHFKIKKEDVTKARCNLCLKVFTRGEGRGSTTSTLRRHLRVAHPIPFAALAQPDERSEAHPPSSQQSGQLTMEQALDRSKLWDFDDPRAVEIHYAIGEMIALDIQPFSAVEDVGFRRLLKKLKPYYQVPGRKYVDDNIVTDIYTRSVSKIKGLVRDAKWGSITSDGWTSPNCSHSFQSVTAHWIDGDFGFKECLLAVKHLEESHTGTYLADTLKKALVEYGIHEKTYMLVRDNGRNIVACGNLMEMPHNSCFLHNLNLIVKDAINSQRTVNDLIKKARAISGHFSHSSQGALKLVKIQGLLGLPKHTIPQDVSTRWNSTYYLLERVLEQKRAIIMYSAEEDSNRNLTSNEWNLLMPMVSILKPFQEMTKIFSANNSVISDVIPTVGILRSYLSMQDPTHHGILTLKAALLTSLEKRFEGIEIHEHLAFPCLLDPRYKDSCFSESVDLNELKTRLCQRIYDQVRPPPDFNAGTENNLLTAGLADPHEDSAGTSNLPHPLTLLQSTHQTIWNCFDQIKSKRPRIDIAQAVSEDETRKRAIRYELDSFCSTELLPLYRASLQPDKPPTRNHPLDWWKQNESAFPNLANYVKKIFSAPPSSIAGERVFSEAGLVYDDRRSRLLPEKAERLIFLHHNLKKLNFEY